MARAIPTNITLEDTSDDDMISYLLTSCTSANLDKALSAMDTIKTKQQAKKLLWMSVAACTMTSVSVKAIDAQFASVALPAELMQTDGKAPNMSLMAIIGHVLFLEADQIKKLARLVGPYRASLGGAMNIQAFGVGGTVPGKEERTKLLRKWAMMFMVDQATRRAITDAVAKLNQILN